MAGFALEPVPTGPGDVCSSTAMSPHGSKPNMTDAPRRVLYVTYNLPREGDHRARYFAEKRANFPPDVESAPGVEYKFRV